MTFFRQMSAGNLRQYAVFFCAVSIRWYHFVPWYGYRRLRRDCMESLLRLGGRPWKEA